jgi:hypothetical protein
MGALAAGLQQQQLRQQLGSEGVSSTETLMTVHMRGCPLLPVLHWHHLLLLLRWALQRLQVVLCAHPPAATAAHLLQR